MKMLKRGISAILILTMLFSLFCVSALAAIGSASFTLDAENVTVDGTADKTVRVVFRANARTPIIGLEGWFRVSGSATQYLTLNSYDCPVGELTGMNEFSLVDGKVTYTDDVAFTGYTVDANGNVFTAIYTVDKNTPTGDYTVSFSDVTVMASMSDMAGGMSFNTTIHVTNNTRVPVTSVTLDNTTLNLTVGDNYTLEARVDPADATNKNVTWSSSNEDVATVDENGKVTAVKAGNATITVTTEDGSYTATCTVTVTAKPVPVTGISLDDAEVSVGRTIQLKPKFTPTDTTQRGVTWASSDETIATVDTNGNVKGLAEGTVRITVTSTENPDVTATCTVTVTKRNDDTVWAGGSAIVGGVGDDGVIFKDVSFRNYYYNAVKWAVERNITSGTSRYTFSPDAVCTRAQTVTFLWRAAGCPKAENRNNPFTDVHTGDYFYEAVLWAVESGITNGTSAATFSPDATVSRAQVVTFLWRAEGQPDAAASGFADVSANAYYAKAVDWAFACGITTGMDYGTFGADAECTRAQIVTFLYRSAR